MVAGVISLMQCLDFFVSGFKKLLQVMFRYPAYGHLRKDLFNIISISAANLTNCLTYTINQSLAITQTKRVRLSYGMPHYLITGT